MNTKYPYPLPGHEWPDHGGIYIGIILNEATNDYHHLIVAGDQEYDISANYDNARERLAFVGTINGYSDWRHGTQRELMLAYVNARHLFMCKTSAASIQVSSTISTRSHVWTVNFYNGRVETARRHHEYALRPFRSIPITLH